MKTGEASWITPKFALIFAKKKFSEVVYSLQMR